MVSAARKCLHVRNKVRIVKAGALNPLVELMQSKNANLQESAAAAAILALSASTLNKSVIGASGSTPLLVEMLICGSVQGKVDAVMALHNLSTLPENLVPILAAGACYTPLIRLLKDCKKSSKVAEKIIVLLGLLMDFEEGRSSIIKEEGTGLLKWFSKASGICCSEHMQFVAHQIFLL